MSQGIITALIAGAVGLLTGAIGSLIAPWVNWGIEKRRKRHDNRARLINTWRAVISDPNFERTRITTHPTYGSLKPLLTKQAIESLHRPENAHIVVRGSSDPNYADRSLLQAEIGRIEKEWGLV
jgi:hypothetical protein